jgi:multisubunit Na+/H+ antiporter MnhC subunit
MLQKSPENANFERTSVTSPAEDEGNFMRRVGSAAILTAIVIHFF